MLSALQHIQVVHVLLLCSSQCGHTQKSRDDDFPLNGHPAVFCNIASKKPMEYGFGCTIE